MSNWRRAGGGGAGAGGWIQPPLKLRVMSGACTRVCKWPSAARAGAAAHLLAHVCADVEALRFERCHVIPGTGASMRAAARAHGRDGGGIAMQHCVHVHVLRAAAGGWHQRWQPSLIDDQQCAEILLTPRRPTPPAQSRPSTPACWLAACCLLWVALT